MRVAAAIAKLEAAQGDPRGLALATLDIVISSREEWVREALEAAAIAHWFTEETLVNLLKIDQAKSVRYLEALKTLPMVEVFSERAGWNVHEASRLGVRARLARTEPQRFRELSSRAAAVFAEDYDYQRVERIYHLLVAQPTQNTSELLKHLWQEWDRAGQHQTRQMLAITLRELLESIPLEPISRARALLCRGMSDRERENVDEAEKAARESLAIFHSLGDLDGEAAARSLLGEVLCVRGRLKEASTEYWESERSMLELSEKESDNAERRRELPESRIDEILVSEGQIEDEAPGSSEKPANIPLKRFQFDDNYLASLRNDDPETWRHFNGYFRPRIRAKLRAQVRWQLVDDLVGEVLVSVLQKIREGLPANAASLPAYVLGVCYSEVLKRIRVEASNPTVSGIDWDLVSGHNLTPQEQVLNQEEARKVESVLSRLTGRERDVLISVFYEKLDRDQLSAKLAVTREQLKILLFRARQRFQREWVRQ
jgi:RNA polymerase sigma factor (sigma-70 family)